MAGFFVVVDVCDVIVAAWVGVGRGVVWIGAEVAFAFAVAEGALDCCVPVC